MRARLAVASADVQVHLREVLLRDKPSEFLETSPSGTVPCLKAGSTVIDESFDIMLWALRVNDPESWLSMPDSGFALIEECDGPFKTALDRYKYSSRHADVDIAAERHAAGQYLNRLEAMLSGQDWLYGNQPRLADMAILPFVRQFAHVDLAWFNALPCPGVIRWLEAFKASSRFGAIMTKYPHWQAGDAPVIFPAGET
jgi:glutathione S-transferase